MEDKDAIAGLKRLGLTTYEARVFVGLQKLDSGTASEVSEVADVPRSQVYGAAEGLEERELVETQQSTPTVYQPVPLEQARTQLLDQLAETGAETFDYLESVQSTESREERTESIWMMHGRDSVTSRTVDLAARADQQFLYAVNDPELVTPEIVAAFAEAADRGVTVALASISEAVLDRVADEETILTYRVPTDRDLDVSTARLLVADGRTILLSTHAPCQNGGNEEVAFWASDNAFAAVLAELAEAWLEDPFE
jgi:sugar-specific transcriptional regulator TrmB